jgi:SAM-dependent methyltransferase
MPSLAERNLQPEIMDDPGLSFDEHADALRALARIHALTGLTRRIWRSVAGILREEPCDQLTIMDVGCGDGLLLRELWKRAKRQECNLRLIGCDISPQALQLCRSANEAANIPCELYCMDVIQEPLPCEADIIVNSLFLHHFGQAEVVQLLGRFADRARKKVIIEDLIRSQLGYVLCWLGVHCLTRCRVVHFDGPQSVRAAFSISEMGRLLGQAGLPEARITKHWPERFLIELPMNKQASHD